ncbi:MAG: VWA domain-containing protein [Actinobacteria bacterium]|uniref:VWA domain-containing protein n=1 Tax=Nostocoides veronense TaxID=330836 RepID=A0ABP4XGZ4_9MICO|nr:VWA domain-containing protein [Actinomycetota bacterium]
MTFGIPWALLALLVLPVLVWVYRSAWRRARAGRESLARTGLRPAGDAASGRGQHGAPALLLASLALLIVASAAPASTLTITKPEGTVMLAFDVSNSMLAEDVKPHRLTAAKAAAKAFIAKQPASVRIGLVAFSDTGIVTQPPSDDPVMVSQAVDRMTARGGTSLGSGIFAALQAISGGKLQADPETLAKDPDSIDIGYYGSGRIVLLSDGQDSSRVDPLAMARLASVAGVRIDTVGLGTAQGASVTINGVTQQTQLDSRRLTDIADATNGAYHEASDAAGLTAIYQNIKLTDTSRRELTGLAPYFMIAGLLLAAAAAGVSLARTGRVISA